MLENWCDPEQMGHMGNRRFDSMMDLARHDMPAVISCHGCGHRVSMAPDVACKTFGMATRFMDVDRRLVCSGCGARRGRIEPAVGRRF